MPLVHFKALTRFLALSAANRRRLKYVAALAVFLTFISREVLRDHYRDLADSIERAEATLSIREDIRVNYLELRKIKGLVDLFVGDTLDARVVSHSHGNNKAANEIELSSNRLHESYQLSFSTSVTSAMRKLDAVKSVIPYLPARRSMQSYNLAISQKELTHTCTLYPLRE